MDATEIRVLLALAMAEAPSVRQLAARHGLSDSLLHQVVSGHIKPTPQVLAMLGLHKVVTFEPKEPR